MLIHEDDCCCYMCKTGWINEDLCGPSTKPYSNVSTISWINIEKGLPCKLGKYLVICKWNTNEFPGKPGEPTILEAFFKPANPKAEFRCQRRKNNIWLGIKKRVVLAWAEWPTLEMQHNQSEIDDSTT